MTDNRQQVTKVSAEGDGGGRGKILRRLRMTTQGICGDFGRETQFGHPCWSQEGLPVTVVRSSTQHDPITR